MLREIERVSRFMHYGKKRMRVASSIDQGPGQVARFGDRKAAQVEISLALSEAHSIQELQGALELARCGPCPELLHNQIREAQMKKMLAQQELVLWTEVQQAIREEDMETLLHLLSTHEARLSDEKIEEANRKIPGIQTRIQIRKGLELAFYDKNDFLGVRQAVDAAKRSCLPREEVAIAEERMRQLREDNDIADLARKKQKRSLRSR